MSSIKTLCNEVELLVQFPEVGLAIADSIAPIPGYLLGEINAITYIDYGSNCKPLVNFLISRLQVDTPLVSIKILKLLLYLVKNGHTEMVEEVKIHEVALKEAMGFHGAPDDQHGKSFYENIRKLSRELLNFIFLENKEIRETPTPTGLSDLTGYGANVNAKGLPGFGFSVKSQSFQETFDLHHVRCMKTLLKCVYKLGLNFVNISIVCVLIFLVSYKNVYPVVISNMSKYKDFSLFPQQNSTNQRIESVSEKISDGVVKFFEELIPAGEKLMQEEQTSHLSENLPQYKPLIINKSLSESDKVMIVSDSEVSRRKLPTRQTKSKKAVYKPGKPGGGWNDSDEEEDNLEQTDNLEENVSKTSSASFDCIDINKLELKDNVSDYIEEHKVADEFCVNEPLYELDYKNISSLCKRCTLLNCDKILIFLLEKLEMKEEIIQLRALILIEYLIFQDVVSLEALMKIVIPPLTNLYEKAEDAPDSVKIKTKKVCLIIQNLSKSISNQVVPDTSKVPITCKIQS